MANPESIDHDRDGADDRGADTAPGNYTATTNQYGQARVSITVSMQPGNNYRAAASCIEEAVVSQIDQAKADALNLGTDPDGHVAPNGGFTGYQVPVVWSPMLTVWRKLTLEVDSMGRESQILAERFGSGWEWDTCDVALTHVGVPVSGFTTIECARDEQRVAYPGIDMYEGGAFVRGDTGEQFLIVRSDPIPITLVLWGDPGPNIIGTTCTIRDDDPYFSSPDVSRQLPKTSVLDTNIRSLYRDAYIEIVEADSGVNLNRIVDHYSNVTATGLNFDYFWGVGVAGTKDLDSTTGFWARHLLVCYQPGAAEDFDSDGFENGAISHNVLLHGDAPYPNNALRNLADTMDWGAVSGVTVYLPLCDAMSTVYLETIRDKDVHATSGKFWQYAAHEIGHSTIDIAGVRKSEPQEHAEGGLMTQANDLQNTPGFQCFSSQTIIRLREVGTW